jgi:hypothetical protein
MVTMVIGILVPTQIQGILIHNRPLEIITSFWEKLLEKMIAQNIFTFLSQGRNAPVWGGLVGRRMGISRPSVLDRPYARRRTVPGDIIRKY